MTALSDLKDTGWLVVFLSHASGLKQRISERLEGKQTQEGGILSMVRAAFQKMATMSGSHPRFARGTPTFLKREAR